MKKIIKESFQDIESYLRGSELIQNIIETFGKDFYESDSYGDIEDFIVRTIKDRFDDSSVRTERVVVCKVVDEDIDLIGSDHYVVNYNGVYYDYTAQQFNDSFNGLVKLSLIPVTQKVIHSDEQINDKLSTIKGYVLLGY